jgi:hypothetical protein
VAAALDHAITLRGSGQLDKAAARAHLRLDERDMLVRPHDPSARHWLDLLDDEVEPRVMDSLESSLVVWSSLWPDRPDERIRFDIVPDGNGSRLGWTLLTPGPEPTASKIGHMRFRLNVLINGRLRRSYGQ